MEDFQRAIKKIPFKNLFRNDFEASQGIFLRLKSK